MIRMIIRWLGRHIKFTSTETEFVVMFAITTLFMMCFALFFYVSSIIEHYRHFSL